MNNILDNDIKSISIDSIKFKNIFNKYTNIDLNNFHENYKSNPLFKKLISLAIKLNCKIFKLIDNKYILKSRDELLLYANKIKKLLIKKYAINILKNLIDDKNDIISKLDDDLNKLKKYFIYIEMFSYLLSNIFINDESIKILCVSNIENNNTISSGKLECISSTTSNIDMSLEGNIKFASYINMIPSNTIISKGKIINISLKNYIAEYSN